MSDYHKHRAIEAFKRHFKTEHGVDVYVFLPKVTLARFKVDLNLLEGCTYNAFIKNNPDLKHIKSMKDRVRTRRFMAYYQAMCQIAWVDGHRKNYIANYLGKNHASIINAIRQADNFFFAEDKEFLHAYREILKQILKDVGTIPKNIKEKLKSKSSIDPIWDEARRFIAQDN